jgi:NitT/TauT family transport system substrate-binding protein
VGFTRTVLNGAGMKEGTDYTFLPVGDGGTAAAAFERGEIEAYAAATSDAAILTTRGLKLREITPDEYKSYFANGFAAKRDYIDANKDVIEGFSRALGKALQFGMDPANRETVLKHAAAANPQEGEDTALANALLSQLLTKQNIGDQKEGWGYQRQEDWEKWQQSLLDSGGLKEKLDLSKAYTNDFIQARQ